MSQKLLSNKNLENESKIMQDIEQSQKMSVKSRNIPNGLRSSTLISPAHRKINITGNLDQTIPCPSTYNIESIFSEKKPLSTIPALPNCSFGIKPSKQSFFYEGYKQFQG